MRNYKNALKHINKEELSTQKVELALVDDLKTRYKALSKDIALLLNSKNEYFRIKRGMQTLLGVLGNSIKAQSKDVDKAISAAKELGIDDKQFFVYKKQVQEIEQELKSIDKKLS